MRNTRLLSFNSIYFFPEIYYLIHKLKRLGAKTFPILGLLLLTSMLSNAQSTAPKVLLPSPNAAALGVYGQVPVSLFNGLPQISIPIENIKAGGADVDISLSYYAGGIRPDDHPGWVGSGWNVNVGGSITRKVNGGVDEIITPGFDDENIYSYYYDYGYLNNPDWYSEASLKGIYSSPLGRAIPDPDEFIFNFGNYSGSFYYNHKGKWQVKSDQPIGLEVELMNNFELQKQQEGMSSIYLRRIFYKFTLITPDGAKYIFGGNPQSIEFTRGSGSTNSYNSDVVPNSWFLTKIITNTKREVNFLYERGPIIAPLSTYASIYSVYAAGSPIGNRGFKLGKAVSIINPVYLKEIQTLDQKVVFSRSKSNELSYNYDDVNDDLENMATTYSDISRNGTGKSIQQNISWQKLDSISFYTNTSVFLKKFAFSYKELATSRLMLDSVREMGSDRSSKPAYQFFYNNGALPDYNSRKTDHWGFYNGRDYFGGFPRYGTVDELWANVYKKENIPAYTLSKDQDTTLMAYGTISSIKYPTGGTTNFKFEPHEFGLVAKRYPFEVESTANTKLGGLRISKIWDEDEFGKISNLKEYRYVLNYNADGKNSSGILAGRPQYLEEGKGQYSKGGFIDYWYWNDYSVEPLSQTNGSYITYTEVAEKLADGSYTIFNYSNHDQIKYRDAAPMSIIHPSLNQWLLDPNTSFSLLRGKLLEKRMYSSGNIIQRDTRYEYNETIGRSDEEAIRVDHYKQRYFNLGNGLFENRSTAYYIYTFPVLMKKESDFLYDAMGLNPVNVEKNKEYDASTYNVIQESQLSSSGNGVVAVNHITSYRYPNNMLNTDPTGIYNKMYTDHVLSPVIEKSVYSDKSLVSGERITYYSPFAGIYLPKLQEHQGADGRYESILAYNNYDKNGNILSLTQIGGNTINYIWSNLGLLPAAEITNVDYSTIENTVGKAKVEALRELAAPDKVAVDNFLAPLKTAHPEAFIKSFSYKPSVGMSSETDIKDKTTFYDYDEFGRLRYVKDQNNYIIKAINYNYSNQKPVLTFKNATRSGIFTKNDCASGTGTQVTYEVPKGTYTSFQSVDAANAMADREIAAKGQAYANHNGSCTPEAVIYKNVERSGMLTKNDCATGTGTQVLYTIPAGKYSSTQSVEAANTLADAEFGTEGQKYANTNGSCTPSSVSTYFNITNKSNNIVYFLLNANGNIIAGPQSVGPNSTLTISGNVPASANSTLVFKITSGYIPNSAVLNAFWGRLYGGISVKDSAVTFTGAKLSVSQSVDVTFN
ncbi:DUF5977 domain-containing protein [Pedobacter cryoconitis]|uniref:DUF5977 domain-containing protein n=1 Tax=Pedobacter cryoconitis TaxID=188932 RepID=A0A7X0MKP9_9SPHI|nr:DUF5977 domain-containing protein [Pedobacter cryoconitis]MBB6502757.1 hypothetical protein [Pedobacter cryoconitis]